MVAGWYDSLCAVHEYASQGAAQECPTRTRAHVASYLVVTIRTCCIGCYIALLSRFDQIRDRQISISLGKPMIIHDSDCDVEALGEVDLKGESPETIAYVLAQARLSIAG